jgi:hypothetical protein
MARRLSPLHLLRRGEYLISQGIGGFNPNVSRLRYAEPRIV